MKCANHPVSESVAYCAQCGRPLCEACKRDVSGTTYCESCLGARLRSPLLTPLGGPGNGANPGLALVLGFIPGVGAVYNGQTVKAMVQVLIFGSLIALKHRVGDYSGAIFGLAIVAFYFYMVIDSYRTARAKQLNQPTPEWFGLGDVKMDAPVGAAVLIGLGVLLLLDNLGIPIMSEVGKFWPVLLIALGILMIQRRGRAHPSSLPPRTQPASKDSSGASGGKSM